MHVFRTPDERFAALPGWPFTPRYSDVASGDGVPLRVHFVDEGDRDAPAVLLMHGEPTWSYLYRKMIPPLVDAGLRVIAPDLVGFGRSDKPTAATDYSYARHVAWMTEWLDGIDAGELTLFGQDWGGLIGLRLVTGRPERFARVVVANTGLPTGDHDPGEAFRRWLAYSQTVEPFPVSSVVARWAKVDLTAGEIAAYDAPFPTEPSKAAARIFPSLVPIGPDDPEAAPNRAAWQVLQRWHKPFLTAFSDADPITAGAERPFQKLVPGARDRSHVTIGGAGHFLQEDRPDELANVIAAFVRTREP
jgi:haloalkane dehalogenase